MDKTFGKKSRNQVKLDKKDKKLWYLLLCSCSWLLPKIHFYKWDWILPNSVYLESYVLSFQLLGNSWENSCTNSIIQDIMSRFTSGKSNLYWNKKKKLNYYDQDCLQKKTFVHISPPFPLNFNILTFCIASKLSSSG